jgi:hypothetical protein
VQQLFEFKNKYFTEEVVRASEIFNIFCRSNEEFREKIKPVLHLPHEKKEAGDYQYLRFSFGTSSVIIHIDINIKKEIWDGLYESVPEKPKQNNIFKRIFSFEEEE